MSSNTTEPGGRRVILHATSLPCSGDSYKCRTNDCYNENQSFNLTTTYISGLYGELDIIARAKFNISFSLREMKEYFCKDGCEFVKLFLF